MTRRVNAIWSATKQENWRLYCFRDIADAEAFQAHFGGERFDPKRQREKGLALGAWRRTDAWRSITESGPLRLNPVFLREPGNMEYDDGR